MAELRVIEGGIDASEAVTLANLEAVRLIVREEIARALRTAPAPSETPITDEDRARARAALRRAGLLDQGARR